MLQNTLYSCFRVCAALLLLVSCQRQGKTGEAQGGGAAVPAALECGGEMNALRSFFGSCGVAVFQPTDANLETGFDILQEDGRVYCHISPLTHEIRFPDAVYRLRDFEQDSAARKARHFFPHILSSEYYVYHFEYVKAEANRVRIVLEDASGFYGYIVPGGAFLVQSWEDHLVGALVTDFDRAGNPVRLKPEDGAAQAHVPEDDAEILYEIHQVSGEWVEVVCSDACDTPCPTRYTYDGWIRWKKGDKFLLKLGWVC